LGSFLKITETAQIFGNFFHGKSYKFSWTKLICFAVLDKRDITSDLKNGLQCQRILKLERI
jgi:hypothetical protein